jgi:catechol 2,3-dioxygenase-like lactoylglutathione lyase family enzyme
MFSHIFVGVRDFERALAFYNPLMAALGMVAKDMPVGITASPSGT